MKTVNDFTNHIENALEKVVGINEARQFALLLFDYLRGYSRADILLLKNEPLTGSEKEFLNKALQRLLNNEPIQYVTCQTEFLGLVFRVDPRVLIPRPETEELVMWILEEFSGQSCSVLDIGTGSGCIPVTIKKQWPGATIEAWDVSVEALELATENARLNGVEIAFEQRDVLNPGKVQSMYDIIVSNPPYVTQKEMRLMSANVLDFEPHLALFVEDSNPLLFYKAIADLSSKILRPGGRLYFEINAFYGEDVSKVLQGHGFSEVVLKQDLSGRDRMVRAIWPGASNTMLHLGIPHSFPLVP